MKKLLIILLMLFPLAAESATITATKAGNWSDTSVWDLGRIPAAGDDVALAGYDIVWDTALVRIPSTSGTLTSITTTGTDGTVTIALDDAAFHDGAGLYATTITAGAGPTSSGMIIITGTTDHVLTFVGGTSAGQGIIGGTANNGSFGIYHNSTGTLNIQSRITGGSAANTHGVNIKLAGTTNITGDLYGGSGISSCGVLNSSTATVSITGDLYGGQGSTAAGILNNSTGQVTLYSGSKLTQGTKGAAYEGSSPAWQPASSSYAKFYTGASFGQAANTEFKQPQTTGSAQ